MEKIPLVVGNEIKGGQLYTVTLKEYLENFRLYLHNPQSWKGSKYDTFVFCFHAVCRARSNVSRRVVHRVV